VSLGQILSAFQYVASFAFPDPLAQWGFRISFILETLLVMRNEQSIIGGREDATSIDGAVAALDYGMVVVVSGCPGTCLFSSLLSVLRRFPRDAKFAEVLHFGKLFSNQVQ